MSLAVQASPSTPRMASLGMLSAGESPSDAMALGWAESSLASEPSRADGSSGCGADTQRTPSQSSGLSNVLPRVRTSPLL